MDVRILGPFEVRESGRPLALGRGKQTALLARLVLDANRVVSVDVLIDDLWGEDPPETAVKMVQVYVSKLRKLLPVETLRTRAPGYLLELPPGAVDLERFEALLAEGRSSLAAGRADETSALLREALALWRSPALAEFEEPFALVETARLGELRLSALEERIDADLALGRHAELASELEALVARHPLRERLRAQHMLAVYRIGRQADALASYQAFRLRLSEELGIEPSSRLKELERRILRQEHDLEIVGGVQPAPAAGEAEPKALPVHYATSDGVSIAYQVVGDGPLDLVLVHGWVCPFQPGWEYPRVASFYRRLAAMGRLILFDKRGTGLSDRVSPDNLPDLETRMDDLRAVMDAAGSHRAVLVGVSEGGPMSALFAATYPERTVALALMGTFARRIWAPDYPPGLREETWQSRQALKAPKPGEDWGLAITRTWLARVAPAASRDEETLRWYASYVVRGASPGAENALSLMNREIDVRHVLPAIRVPTLLTCRAKETNRDATQFMGKHIPGARTITLPGEDHLPWEGDQDALLDEIAHFVAGLDRAASEEAELDRVLVTLLFAHLARPAGDEAPGETLVDRHGDVIRAQLARFRGRTVGSGEGLLAVFDGPARAIRCACAIANELRALGSEIRAGLHTGEVLLANGDVQGVAVETGAAVAAKALPGEVLVSRTVKDLVAGSGLQFDDRGRHELDGIPDESQLLAVRSPAGP
jgi:DNA-binding SARP family transcriptional activator/pimeloyl-ACP methyl ester carboxylesterase